MMRRALAGLLAALFAACDGGGAHQPDAGTDVGSDADWRVVHVVAGAAPGGDGSEARPYASLADAVRDTAGIRIYRLSPGVHALPAELQLGHGAALVGSGSTLTTLLGPVQIVLGGQVTLSGVGLAGEFELAGDVLAGPDLEILGADLAMRERASLATRDVSVDVHGLVAPDGASLRIADGARAGLADLRLIDASLTVDNVADVAISALEVLGSPSPALVLNQSVADLRDVRIEDVEGDAFDASGDALRVQGGTLRAEDVSLVRVAGRALFAEGADVEAENLTVEGAGLAAVIAATGATIRLQGGSVREAGTLVLATSGSAVSLMDTDLSDARQLCGVASGADSHLTAVGGYVADCPDGAFSFLDGGSGTLDGVLVDRTSNAGCVAVADTTDVLVTRSTLRACAGSGVGVLRSSGVEVTEAEVVELRADPVAEDATASLIAVDSAVVFRNSSIAGGPGAGIRLLRSGGQVSENTIVSTGGEGISVVGRGTSGLAVVANSVSDALGTGILAADVSLQIAGNTVAGTRWSAIDGIGDGIVFGESADVEVRNNRVSACAGNGISWFAPATGVVDGNRVEENAGFGLFEYCLGDEAAAVLLGANELINNVLGSVSGCP